MLKGILEGCLLGIIRKQEVYGYEMTQYLKVAGLTVSDGSIYPLLLKLQKEQLIVGTFKPSLEGPQRKYYQITDKGEAVYQQFLTKWQTINQAIQFISQEEQS